MRFDFLTAARFADPSINNHLFSSHVLQSAYVSKVEIKAPWTDDARFQVNSFVCTLQSD